MEDYSCPLDQLWILIKHWLKNPVKKEIVLGIYTVNPDLAILWYGSTQYGICKEFEKHEMLKYYAELFTI